MVGVISANDVDPLRLASFDVVLASKLDCTFICFRSRREEDGMRQTPGSVAY